MNSVSKTRIILTAQNAALRDGLVALIQSQPDMEIVSTPVDADHALYDLRRMEPEVVIVDVDIPYALNLMRSCRRERPQAKVISLVNYEWDAIAQAAGFASGSPSLPKDHISAHLLTSIRNSRAID
jgi:DNA-binding NarL/FixJ family response regulator